MGKLIHQGEVYWLDFGPPVGSGPGYQRPVVVVQNDIYNRSKIQTTVVCSITANLRRAADPGNLLLRAGEGGLGQASVVNVTQIITVDKRELGERMGRIAAGRVRQILAGVSLALEPDSFDG